MSTAKSIEDRAALWLVRSEEPHWSEEDQKALDAWLDEAMAHKAAYWRLEHGWRAADRIASLGEAPELRTRVSWFPRGPYWRPVAIAASLLLAIALGAFYFASSFMGDAAPEARAPAAQATQFATAVGARKTITLADGSRVELNTATRVRASVTPARREFWLDSGEAYFEVVHAADHPFVVHAGTRDIVVLGTKFSVRRDGDRVSVSVVEGRVRVEQGGAGGGRSSTVTGGDVVIGEGPSLLVASNASERVQRDLSWRRGMLAFDQATLAEAAAEFNRYNTRQLVIDDPETAGIRIGGTFRSNNIDAFVRLLRQAYGLRIEARGEETRISG